MIFSVIFSRYISCMFGSYIYPSNPKMDSPVSPTCSERFQICISHFVPLFSSYTSCKFGSHISHFKTLVSLSVSQTPKYEALHLLQAVTDFNSLNHILYLSSVGTWFGSCINHFEILVSFSVSPYPKYEDTLYLSS